MYLCQFYASARLILVSYYVYTVCYHIYLFFLFLISAPSSRSEPSPKTSRQSLSIKQAFLGGKADGKIYSPHSPKSGDERRALKGKDDSSECSNVDRGHV